MEIRHYLKALGRPRSVLLLIVFPLGAAGITAALSLRAPTTYVTEATIALPAIETVAQGRQAVADIEAVTDTAAFLRPIAEEFGTTAERLERRLTVQQAGESAVVKFRLATQQQLRDGAPRILDAIVRDAIGELYVDDVAFARASVSRAQADFDEAVAALDAFSQDTGLVLVDEAYRTAQSELSELRVRAETARAAGDVAQADALADDIDIRSFYLQALATQVVEYERLDDVRDAAFARLSDAQQALADAEARVTAASSAAVIRVGQPVEQSQTSLVTRRVLAVVAGALLLACALIALIELRRPTIDLRDIEAAPGALQRREPLSSYG